MNGGQGLCLPDRGSSNSFTISVMSSGRNEEQECKQTWNLESVALGGRRRKLSDPLVFLSGRRVASLMRRRLPSALMSLQITDWVLCPSDDQSDVGCCSCTDLSQHLYTLVQSFGYNELHLHKYNVLNVTLTVDIFLLIFQYRTIFISDLKTTCMLLPPL